MAIELKQWDRSELNRRRRMELKRAGVLIGFGGKSMRINQENERERERESGLVFAICLLKCSV